MPDDMKPYLEADLDALFDYDFTVTIKYKGKQYTAIPSDSNAAEMDELGGPIPIDQNEYHFRTSELPGVENGEEMELSGKKILIMSNIISADGAELIVRTRAA